MLSEGPEEGRDRHLLLQAKHSLNQQKQETLPLQTAAKKDVDTVRDPEQKETFHSRSHSQLKDCIKLVCPPSLYALEDVKACCSYRPIFLELKSALTMCANTFAYDTTKQLLSPILTLQGASVCVQFSSAAVFNYNNVENSHHIQQQGNCPYTPFYCCCCCCF